MRTLVAIVTLGLFISLLVAPAALALTVISPIIELRVEAGQSERGVVKIYNETDQPLALTASVEPFTAQGEDNSPRYLPLDLSSDYVNWFKLADDSLVLQPRQALVVPFTVSVPANTASGGYYAVIFWRTNGSNPGSEPAVGVASKVGTIVLLTVSGSVIEQGAVNSFSVEPSQATFFELPITFAVRFENTGNIYLKPHGTITLTNRLRTITLPVNSEQKLILPGASRRFDVVWGQASQAGLIQRFWGQTVQEFQMLAGGFYQATLELNYGEPPPQLVKQQLTFWFIPYHLIISGFAVLSLLLIAVTINRRVKTLKSGASKKH